MDSRCTLQWGCSPRTPVLTAVILITQSQANGSMAGVMMSSNCTKWQEAFRAHYQGEVISGVNNVFWICGGLNMPPQWSPLSEMTGIISEIISFHTIGSVKSWKDDLSKKPVRSIQYSIQSLSQWKRDVSCILDYHLVQIGCEKINEQFGLNELNNTFFSYCRF